jgi:protein-tyrosine phosphatase
VPELAARARARGLAVLELPIADQGAPSAPEMRALSLDLVGRLRAGETVVVHCLGGLGRSGLVAACVLADLGAGADGSVARVRDARGPRAIESAEQESFVRAYATSGGSR